MLGSAAGMGRQHVAIEEYRALADFRYYLRRFLVFAEASAKLEHLSASQYQVLLALKGLPPESRSTIGYLADRLQVKHHSAVEIVDRMARRGLVRRVRASADRRQVFVTLTRSGSGLLRRVAARNLHHLRATQPALVKAIAAILEGSPRGSERRRKM
jgi:DNA-binding MarR family transcriptional regulator